jgi:threonine dehydrogenase-like Zn-dependent dehydrogenase
VIAAMGLGGMRRLQIEVGESAMVVGLGLLGLFAVQFCRLAGAYPVVAVDFDPKRRELAIKMGADRAVDPSELAGMEREIDTCVEVTGYASALKNLLPAMKYFGRVSLLGCTRVSDELIDYYSQVHKPGIQLIGGHNMARPAVDSRPGCWTHQDDCKAILKLIEAGRISIKPMLGRVVDPEDCAEIYRQLCEDADFPVGTVFDWRDKA